jgi:hypothetical protein
MSLAPVAEAKIIYTPTHIQIPPNSHSLIIDFNYEPKHRDADLFLNRFSRGGSGISTSGMGIAGAGYDRAFDAVASASGLAAALRPGARMGPHNHVTAQGLMAVITHTETGERTTWRGQWANSGKGLKNGYLGLKFTLNGEIHYGWARVSLTVKGNRIATATLTGYAFETIPNKSIIIGKTQGADVIVEPATLGDLAAGAGARVTK